MPALCEVGSFREFGERTATGLFASDVVVALGRIQAGEALDPEGRETLAEARGLLKEMSREGAAVLEPPQYDLRRQLDMFEVVAQGRTVEQQGEHLARLAKATDAALEAGEWNDELARLQEFFGELGSYELGITSARFNI